MTENPRLKDLAIAAGIIGTSFLPIFRSGGRTGLTFGTWVVNHTIFGPPVEYIPSEDYARELEGVKIMQAYNQPVALAVAKITDIWYWDSSLGIYNPWLTEPPTILIGTEAGAQAIVKNVSDEYLDLGLIITVYDPLGNPLGLRIVGPTLLAPGGSLGNHYRVVTERPGIYTITTDIITSPAPPYGKIGPTLSWPVAYVVGEIPPLAGHVYDPFVVDVTTGEAFYSLPVEIDGEHEVIVGIHWINDGDETATFTPIFELIDPDGISREIQTFDTVLSPTKHTGGQTESFVKLDKAGMWKIHATLEAEGTLVDEKTWDAISVTVPPPEFAGTITKKQLEYDGAQALIPVSNITQGARALLRVTGRNDTPDAQRMGITWMVYDPLGRVVNQYAAWEDWPFTGGYKEHEFHKFGGEFTLSEVGEYKTEIWLLMNPDDPVTVDRYEGVLCTVVKEVIPPECTIDADCPEGYACVGGKCIPIPPECTIDADCPEGYLCVNGKCVPKEEVEKKFPWAPVAIGAGALVAVIGFATAAKKGAK